MRLFGFGFGFGVRGGGQRREAAQRSRGEISTRWCGVLACETMAQCSPGSRPPATIRSAMWASDFIGM